MRVAFVTQWFPPEPAHTPLAYALALEARGYDVDVLTGFPNYPSGQVVPPYRIQPCLREQLSPGVTVYRAALYPNHSTSVVGRMVNYASFAAGSLAVAMTALPRPDVWLVYSSPATASVPALLSSGRRRAPVATVIQDLWPDSVLDSGMLPNGTRRLTDLVLGRYSAWSYRRSTAIGIISPGMREVLTGRGIPTDRIHDTPNWTFGDHLRPDLPTADARAVLNLPSGYLVVYAGNHGPLQHLAPVIDAVRRVDGVQLVLIGSGVSKASLQQQADTSGARNVHFLDAMPPERLGRVIQAADAQLVSLRDTPLLRATMPSKVQTSLAAARPVVAHASGDVADVITRCGAGVSVSPGDVDGLVRALRALAAQSSTAAGEMGLRGRRYYDQHYSPAVGGERVGALVEAAYHAGVRRAAAQVPVGDGG